MSKMDPFFSVIITTYNRESLILETLETVLNQSFDDFEVIIVDDASTDNTVKVLNPYLENEKVRLIVNEKNSERCVSRNNGLRAARGKYATIIDSDDFMYKDCLKDAADFIQKHPEFHFFHNYYELVDDDRKTVYNYQFPKRNEFTRKFAEGNFVSCIGVFVSKEVYSNYLFNEDPRVMGSEDWEIWLRVYADYDLGVIPKINCGARHHENRSVNSLDYEKIIDVKLFIINNLFANSTFEQKFSKYKSFMLASVYIFAAVGANKYHRFKKARAFLFRALKVHFPVLLTERFMRVAIHSFLQIKKSH